MSITIFLADDHAVVRDGLRLLLDAHQDLKVIGDTDNGRDAVKQVDQLSPDVAILDIAMPLLNGIEAAQRICENKPSVQVVILSVYATAEHIIRALRAGANGYLLKESAGAEVVSAVRAVHAGKRYLSQKVSNKLVDDYLSIQGSVPTRSPLDNLSTREVEILQLVVEGQSSLEIADALNLSRKTIESYRSRVMQKLDISDITKLVKFAIQQGLISLE